MEESDVVLALDRRCCCCCCCCCSCDDVLLRCRCEEERSEPELDLASDDVEEETDFLDRWLSPLTWVEEEALWTESVETAEEEEAVPRADLR